MNSEIVVIGAGITGAFAAYCLARGGHHVVLLDGASAPYRASGCNPGGINPLHGPGLPHPMAEFYLSSHRLHSQLSDELPSLSGLDYGFRVIDRLFLAFAQDEQRQLSAMSNDYASAEGFTAQWMDSGELRQLDPRISQEAVGGLFTHGNIIVDCERYCDALISAMVKSGGRHLCKDVTGFTAVEGRVSHVQTVEAAIACQHVVIAAGYRTDTLCGLLGRHLPVHPVKGELLIVKWRGKPLPFDVTRGLSGLYQLKDDLYWLGGTRVAPTGDPETTAEGKQTLLAGCEQMLPGLGPLEIVAHQAGFRPVSADKLPVVGYLPGYTNVLIGTGGGSKGVLLSSGMGQTLCNIIDGTDLGAPPYLAPERFASGS